MRRGPSGLPTFIGAYAVCLMMVWCIFVIQSEQSGFHGEKVLTPPVPTLDAKPREPIHWVVLNPIRKPAAKSLTRPTKPNQLVATIPVPEEFLAKQELAKEIFQNVIVPRSKKAADQFIAWAKNEHQAIDSKKSKSGFSNVSFRKPIVIRPNHQPSSNVSPSVRVGNDFESKQEIMRELTFLKAIVDARQIIDLEVQLEQALDNAANEIDCETDLFRLQNQLFMISVPAKRAEDVRLLDESIERITKIINHWIDTLNSPVQAESIPAFNDEGFQKFKTAIRRTLTNGWF